LGVACAATLVTVMSLERRRAAATG
jgi:hypothetical protein